MKLFDMTDLFSVYGGITDQAIMKHYVNTENIREGKLFIGFTNPIQVSTVFYESEKNIWFDEHNVLIYRDGEFFKLMTGENAFGRFSFVVELASPSMTEIVKDLIGGKLSIHNLKYKGNLGPALLSGDVYVCHEKKFVTSNTFDDPIFSNGELGDYIYSKGLPNDILCGSSDFILHEKELVDRSPLKNTILEDLMYQFDFTKVVDACSSLDYRYRDKPITKKDVLDDMLEILNNLFYTMKGLIESNSRFTTVQCQRGRLKGYLSLVDVESVTGFESGFNNDDDSFYDELYYVVYDNKKWYLSLDLSFFIEQANS